MKITSSFFLLSLVLSVAITSCVDPGGYAGGGFGSSYGNGSGFNTYRTLPRNYSGSAYLYNGQYYSGGQYQTGRYNDQGRNYDGRYFHNGRYYYGGSHAHYQGDGHNHGNSAPQQLGSYRSYMQQRH